MSPRSRTFTAAAPAAASEVIECESGPGCTFGFGQPPIFGDNGPYEFGLKFSSDVAGFITQACYWQAEGDVGTDHHVVLWDDDGLPGPLATATGAGTPGENNCFAFASPVPIAADTIYTVSYNSAVPDAAFHGINYQDDQFVGPVTVGHLTAPADAGVFAQPAGTFPVPGSGAGFHDGYGVQPIFVTAPGAPTDVSATAAGPTSLNLDYTGDGDAGESYDATCTSDTTGGPYVVSSSTTTGPIPIAGITFSPNQTITCSVTETSGLGIAGPAGSATAIYLSPSAPTAVSVSQASATSVRVAFSGDGATGATFTATCTSSAGGPALTALGPTSPLTVSGFTNVTTQTITCSVKESADSLTSAASADGSVVMSGTAPRCPATLTASAKVTAAPGNRLATVSWAPVTSISGCSVLGYLVTPNSGSPVLTLGRGTSAVIGGLTNARSYSFRVAPLTLWGVGPQSAASAPVTVGAPGVPTALTVAKVATGAIKVSFKAPSNNGAAITSYTAACSSSNGGMANSQSGPASPITVTGLTNGRTYTCTVTATNSRGTGPSSNASGPMNA